MTRQSGAICVVLMTALFWGVWWYPVSLLEGIGLQGPWIGVAMSSAIFPAALIWVAIQRQGAPMTALAGGALIGLAVTLYAMAASYTDFIRAVLLFYLAPTWSTLIEILFLGRRWTRQTGLAILLSLTGILLITRGGLGADGIGALGDWMALASGVAWSAGLAMIFATCRDRPSLPFLFTAIGGVAAALIIAAFDGSLALGPPDALQIARSAPGVIVFIIFFVGVLLAGTTWGGMLLPPAVVTYLLSVEVLAGVSSSAIFLDEPFGLFEIGGACAILGAVLIEVLLTQRTEKPGG